MTNIPNVLTVARIVLIPLFVLSFYLPTPMSGLIAGIIFALAGATDWLDGFLARRLNQTSRFGAFLDPVADKLMVAVALILLVEAYGCFLMTFPALVIVGREILISALREWMAEVGKSAHVAVGFMGKVKTTFQMLAIFVLLIEPAVAASFRPDLIYVSGMILLYVSVAITLWSMLVYLNAARKNLN